MVRRRIGILAAGCLVAAACADSPFAGGGAGHVDIVAAFGVVSESEAQAAWSVDAIRVVFRRMDGRIAVDDEITWPGTAETVSAGPYVLAIGGDAERFDVTVHGYAAGVELFGYGPAQITVHSGGRTSMEAVLTYLGLGIEPVPGHIVLQVEGAFTQEFVLPGWAISIDYLGTTVGDFSHLDGGTSRQDSTFSVLLPGALEIGTRQLQAFDLEKGYGDDQFAFTEAFAYLRFQEAFEEGYESARMFVSTAGTVTVVSITPGADGSMVRAEIVMSADGFLIEDVFDGSTWNHTIAPTGETITVRGVIDVPGQTYAIGTSDLTVTGGPYPGAAAEVYDNGYLDAQENRLQMSLYAADVSPQFDVSLSLPNPGVGTFDFGGQTPAAQGSVLYYDEFFTEGSSDSGTVQILEYVAPVGATQGVIRGTISMTVGLLQWDGQAYVPIGSATVAGNFHIPLWLYDLGQMPPAVASSPAVGRGLPLPRGSRTRIAAPRSP